MRDRLLMEKVCIEGWGGLVRDPGESSGGGVQPGSGADGNIEGWTGV